MVYGYLQKKYKIVSWKKKGLEDVKDLLVSYSIIFVIDVSTICWFNIYDIC